MRRFLSPSREVWSVATWLMLSVWMLLFLAFLFINVVPHFSVEKLIGLVALFVEMAVVSLGLLLVFGLAATLKRRFRIGLLLALPPLLLLLVLTWGVAGALIGAGVILSALVLIVGATGTLLRRGSSSGSRLKPFASLTLGTMLIATALPLQGRVWMPQSAPGAEAAPFPLVLLVHGNYEMEVPSDTGYAYLGELLASQGFIVVSVDENFLNGSLADFLNPVTFRFGKENKVRGWLLLEHLTQWKAWNEDAADPLFGKIDMNRIALIGHSRGGEAVAIANALRKRQ